MRIGELADRLGTTPHAIRFYERSGLLPVPHRGENRYRDYTDKDVSRPEADVHGAKGDVVPNVSVSNLSEVLREEVPDSS